MKIIIIIDNNPINCNNYKTSLDCAILWEVTMLTI